MTTILAHKWLPGNTVIGFVLVELEDGEHEIFVGGAQGFSEEQDVKSIAGYGAKLSALCKDKLMYYALFPEFFVMDIDADLINVRRR